MIYYRAGVDQSIGLTPLRHGPNSGHILALWQGWQLLGRFFQISGRWYLATGNDNLDCAIALLAFVHHEMRVRLEINELLNLAGGPTNRQPLHLVGPAQSKMHQIGHLGAKTVERIHLADQRLSLHSGREARADAEPVTLVSPQRDFQ